MPDPVSDNLSRYLHFVYAAARRQSPDAATAEDITQAVFLVLARKQKTAQLPEEKHMFGWLLQTTRYAAKTARRSTIRRAHHEHQIPIPPPTTADVTAADHAELRATLDNALLALGSLDREVLTRRYLHDQPIQSVAAAVGLSENTAGRRIARALEKLRKILLRSGIATPAAALTAFLATEALIKAPPTLAASISTATATTTAHFVAKSLFARFLLTKTIAATTLTATLLTTTIVVVAELKAPAQSAAANPQPTATVPIAAPATHTAATLPFTISKETTVITSPLNPDGTPDYIAALNQQHRAGVTPDSNGFILWLQIVGTGPQAIPPAYKPEVLQLSGAPDTPGMGITFDYFNYVHATAHLSGRTQSQATMELGDAATTPWTPDQFPRVAEFIKTVDPALDKLSEAVALPHWYSPIVGSPVPSSSVQRQAALALCARATLRARAGDFKGFLADITAARRFARCIAGASMLEADAIDDLALQTLGAVVGSGTLTPDQLAALKTATDSIPPMPSIAQALDTKERYSVLTSMELIAMQQNSFLNALFARDASDANATPTPPSRNFINADDIDWDIILKHTNAFIDQEVAALSDPDPARQKARLADLGAQKSKILQSFANPNTIRTTLARKANESREDYSARIADSILANFTPGFPAAFESGNRNNMERDMLTLLITLAELKARTGHWPDKLEDLSPTVKIPTDIYSDDQKSPILYTHSATTATVYSVGKNHLDDGGLNNPRLHADDIPLGPSPDVAP